MRIGTLHMFRQGVSSILDQQTRLFRTQNQLSVGKRIVNPADDPVGSAQLIGLSETAKTTAQFQRNILAVRTRLELQDSALGSVGNAVQRARELTVSALNDTKGVEERTAIANKVEDIEDGLHYAEGFVGKEIDGAVVIKGDKIGQVGKVPEIVKI